MFQFSSFPKLANLMGKRIMNANKVMVQLRSHVFTNLRVDFENIIRSDRIREDLIVDLGKL